MLYFFLFSKKKHKFLFILFFFFFFSFFLYNPIKSDTTVANLSSIQKISYDDLEIKKIRKEVSQNLKKRNFTSQNIVWCKYIIKKHDSFFQILAKTMSNHDTLSSVNNLVSVYDIEVGKEWLIPNMRGIAVPLLDLQKKYSKYYQSNQYFLVPKTSDLYFIPHAKFNPNEKNFFSLKIFIRPVLGKISSGFGIRKYPFENKKKFHKGIDIACKINSKVVASATGIIVFTGHKSGYGKTIIIEHSNRYRTLYGHLNKILVKKNTKVKQGQKIALSGNTGKSTGPHLHFEVLKKGKPIRPHI